jgi:4-hydroxy-tetrahydrodipicolinate synthase
MITPMHADGSVNLDRVAELARALIASGTEGIVITGTTGESPVLNSDEKLAIWETAKEAAGPDVAVIAGAADNNTAQSIALSKEAERLGLDGLLLTVPAYNKPPQAGLIAHFTAIADATSLPGMLYNVPSRTALNMTAETTLRLAEHPNIIGVKEASADYEQIAAIIDGAPEGFRVWSGNDADTLEVMRLGGYGVVSVAAHLAGARIREQIGASVAGAYDAAKAIHDELMPLVDVLFIESNPIPTKFALNELGFDVGNARLPLVPASDAAAATIRAELARHRIDLPVSAKA